MFALTDRTNWIVLFLAVILLTSCAPGQTQIAATPTAPVTDTPPPSPSATYTATATLTPTFTATATVTPTKTATATRTPKPTATTTSTQDPTIGKLVVGSGMFGDSLMFSTGSSNIRPAAGKVFLMIFGDYYRPESGSSIKIMSSDVTLVGADGKSYPLFAGGTLGGMVNQCKNCLIINTTDSKVNFMLIFELDKSLKKESFELQFLNLPLIPLEISQLGG